MLVMALPWIVFLTFTNLLLPRFQPPNARGTMNWELFELACLIGIALLVDLILYRWAKPRLLRRFRDLATEPVSSGK